jgi:hypothetical protein
MNQVDKNNDFELSLDEFMDPKAQEIYKEWLASQLNPAGETTTQVNDKTVTAEADQVFSSSDTNNDQKLDTYEM